MNNIIKQKINDNFIKNYKKYCEIANSFTHNTNNAKELVHITILQIMSRKDVDKIEKILDTNFFVYFVVAIKFQYLYKSSEFNKTIQKRNVEYDNNEHTKQDNDIELEDKKEIEDKINTLAQIINEDKELNWYEKKIWRLYYFPNDEGWEENKPSFRKLSKQTKINYVSLCKTVNKVNDRLKLKLNNK